MSKFLVVATFFVMVFMSHRGSADMCVSFFTNPRAQKETLTDAIKNFTAPIRFIEIVDHKHRKIYSGISAKDQYEKLLKWHLKLYESLSDLKRSRIIEWDLQKALVKAKNIDEAKKIFTEHFMARHKLQNLEADSIIPYQLDSPNIAKVNVKLNPDGSIKELNVSELQSGLYFLRLSGQGAFKEVVFRIENEG